MSRNLSKNETIEYLGKEVDVVIDRKIGSHHPKHDNIIYPINYGYIEDVFSPDGEELDVYILDVFVPIEKYHGKVIAIVNRLNDIENKLVVSNRDYEYTEEEIKDLIDFQEQFYKIEIIK